MEKYKLVLPLFDATLSNRKSFKICEGISLVKLTSQFESKLRSYPKLIARYEQSLRFMEIGLELTPSDIPQLNQLNWSKTLELGYFVAMAIRLATGVPVDIPYWFEMIGKKITGVGNTQTKTYRTSNRYMYPLNSGKQVNGLFALRAGFPDVLDKYVTDANKNVLIRAIEFAAVGFQSHHIPSRLVNNTIYLESLFSNSQTEIAFQIAASVSWYLEPRRNVAERLKLFSEIKDLYSYRSKIVHGADISKNDSKLHGALIFSEELNTRVFQRILKNKHVNIFSKKQSERQKELKLLSLGGNSALLW